MFLRNSWYVFGWNYELDEAGGVLGRVLLAEPVVVWRNTDGVLHAMQDRCPHRHAPLSMGRVKDDGLQCRYHGLTFDAAGVCIRVPGLAGTVDAKVRTFPVAEKNDWIWVWMGDPAQADPQTIPPAFGINQPGRKMRAGRMDYRAHYQLVHDNLCDLSHLDYVHETTLRPMTGAYWSATFPKVTKKGNGLHIERWFESAEAPDGSARVDTWSSYDFFVPGIFIMRASRYPEGTASRCGHVAPEGEQSINETIEQQAVTPIDAKRSAYFFATGVVGAKPAQTVDIEKRIAVIKAAFDEDRDIIEAQQRIWNLTAPDEKKIFLPQDRGPALMRNIMESLIAEERASGYGHQFRHDANRSAVTSCMMIAEVSNQME